jgi:hypothetical protein
MLSRAHATSGRHVSTWAHAILGGKVISLGFPRDGEQTPHACTQTDVERAFTQPTFVSSFFFGPLQAWGGGGGTGTPCYEANCFFL